MIGIKEDQRVTLKIVAAGMCVILDEFHSIIRSNLGMAKKTVE